MNARRAPGFTLLELAITMAVAAILGTLALPSLGARLARERLAQAAETLAADVAEARFQAARQGLTLHLQARAGTEACWAISTHPGGDCTQAQPGQIRRVAASHFGNVSLAQAQALQLAPDGTASSVSGALATLQNNYGEQLAVRVGPLGRPHICAAAGSVGRYPRC